MKPLLNVARAEEEMKEREEEVRAGLKLTLDSLPAKILREV